MPTNYNLSPAPLSSAGRTAFGQVPGNIGKPPSLYQGIESIYPGIGGLTSGAGRVIGSQIRGELSPETINTIQDEAASFGITSGLPNTNFSGYRGLRNLGLNVEGTQRAGVDAYNKYLSTLAPLMDNPELLAGIASWNATNNAAPDPRRAYEQMLADYGRYMSGAAGAGSMGGSPAGGTARTYVNRGELPTITAPSLGTGTTYGGTTYYGGNTPANAYQNWQDWTNSWLNPGGGSQQEQNFGGEFDVPGNNYSPEFDWEQAFGEWGGY